MTSVLDSSAGLKCFLQEAGTDRTLRLREEFRRGLRILIAPDVFAVEVSHALTRAERMGRITRAEGSAHFADMLATLPVLHPYLLLLPRAHAISSQFRIGVYDCLYVALAEREGCELITADERLVNALAASFPFLTSLMATP